ncbi:DUF481 domain-containing protein [candidate division KSB1 bacterium]|nr:DUF481 domain-containing protein [candidate division KSB1 bacterium]
MKRCLYFVSICILLLPLLLLAQESQDNSANSSKSNHWESSMDIGAAIYSGNVDKQDLRGLFSIIRKDELLDFSLDLKSVLSKVDKATKNKEYSLSLKVDYMPKRKLTPFVLFNAYQNIPKGYDSRYGGYLGAKWVLYKNEGANYSLSAAYLFEEENFTTEEQNDASKKSASKLSVRPKITQSISDAATFDMIAFYVPSFDDFKDYRFDLDAGIESKLTAKIFMKCAYTLNYVNLPPLADIAKTDQALVMSIVFKF